MRNCVRCERPGLPEKVVRKASPEQRTAWRSQGIKPLRGRGLCRACHLAADKAGTLIDYETRITPREFVRDEWEMFADRTRSIRSECRRLAPQFGMTWTALERSLNRAGIRSKVA